MSAYDKREFVEEETNETLEDIKKAKLRSRRAAKFVWKSTKKAVRFPSYVRHQSKLRWRRQKERAYQAYVIPFLEPSPPEMETLAVMEMQHNVKNGDHNQVLKDLAEESGVSDFGEWSSLMERYRARQTWRWEAPSEKRRRLKKVELEKSMRHERKEIKLARRRALMEGKKAISVLKRALKGKNPWELESMDMSAGGLGFGPDSPDEDDEYETSALKRVHEEQRRQFLEEIKLQITVIYSEYDPEKIAKLPELIERCQGKELHLLRAIKKRFEVTEEWVEERAKLLRKPKHHPLAPTRKSQLRQKLGWGAGWRVHAAGEDEYSSEEEDEDGSESDESGDSGDESGSNYSYYSDDSSDRDSDHEDFVPKKTCLQSLFDWMTYKERLLVVGHKNATVIQACYRRHRHRHTVHLLMEPPLIRKRIRASVVIQNTVRAYNARIVYRRIIGNHRRAEATLARAIVGFHARFAARQHNAACVIARAMRRNHEQASMGAVKTHLQAHRQVKLEAWAAQRLQLWWRKMAARKQYQALLAKKRMRDAQQQVAHRKLQGALGTIRAANALKRRLSALMLPERRCATKIASVVRMHLAAVRVTRMRAEMAAGALFIQRTYRGYLGRLESWAACLAVQAWAKWVGDFPVVVDVDYLGGSGGSGSSGGGSGGRRKPSVKAWGNATEGEGEGEGSPSQSKYEKYESLTPRGMFTAPTHRVPLHKHGARERVDCGVTMEATHLLPRTNYCFPQPISIIPDISLANLGPMGEADGEVGRQRSIDWLRAALQQKWRGEYTDEIDPRLGALESVMHPSVHAGDREGRNRHLHLHLNGDGDGNGMGAGRGKDHDMTEDFVEKKVRELCRHVYHSKLLRQRRAKAQAEVEATAAAEAELLGEGEQEVTGATGATEETGEEGEGSVPLLSIGSASTASTPTALEQPLEDHGDGEYRYDGEVINPPVLDVGYVLGVLRRDGFAIRDVLRALMLYNAGRNRKILEVMARPKLKKSAFMHEGKSMESFLDIVEAKQRKDEKQKSRRRHHYHRSSDRDRHPDRDRDRDRRRSRRSRSRSSRRSKNQEQHEHEHEYEHEQPGQADEAMSKLQYKISKVHEETLGFGDKALQSTDRADRSYWLRKEGQGMSHLQVLLLEEREMKGVPVAAAAAPPMKRWGFGSGHNSSNKYHHQHYPTIDSAGAGARGADGTGKITSMLVLLQQQEQRQKERHSQQLKERSRGPVDNTNKLKKAKPDRISSHSRPHPHRRHRSESQPRPHRSRLRQSYSRSHDHRDHRHGKGHHRSKGGVVHLMEAGS